MLDPIVVVGIGEMASVFTRGFLSLGHPVFPILRNSDIEAEARALTKPALVLVAVGENDLHPTLERLPETWRDRVGLLQNELLPRNWKAHKIDNPTVISVWFEKKRGQDYKVLVPSPAFGPNASLLERALESLEIPCWELNSEDELLFELVRKNLYILTTNIAGMVAGGNVDSLWNEHQALAREVISDVLDVQFSLIGQELDREKLIAGMVEAIEGDLQHGCMGRSAPARLARALRHADEAELTVSKLREIQASCS